MWIIIDLFSAHRTEEVIAAIEAKGYLIFFIPAGCTSKLQYHDVYFNRVFKKMLNERRAKHNAQNANFTPDRQYIYDTVIELIDAMNTPWMKSKIPGNILSCFLQKAIDKAKLFAERSDLFEEAEAKESAVNERKKANLAAKEAELARIKEREALKAAGIKPKRAPNRPKHVIEAENAAKAAKKLRAEQEAAERQQQRDDALASPSPRRLSQAQRESLARGSNLAAFNKAIKEAK